MSKSATLSESVVATLKFMVRHPIAFVRQPSFLAVYGVYAATYITGNASVTACERAGLGTTATNMWKLWLSFGTNTTLGIAKDRLFARCALRSTAAAAHAAVHCCLCRACGGCTLTAGSEWAFLFHPNPACAVLFARHSWLARAASFRASVLMMLRRFARARPPLCKQLYVLKSRRARRRWYGTKAPTGLPAASWALFFGRDILTIGAGFVVPDLLAGELHRRQLVESLPAAKRIALIVSPVSAQLVLTPMHLLALDIYNNPARGAGARGGRIAAAYPSLTGTRMARVLFAYGTGGIVNAAVRGKLRYGL